MSIRISESIIEQAALDWFKELGYSVLFGPDIVGAIHELPLHYLKRMNGHNFLFDKQVDKIKIML